MSLGLKASKKQKILEQFDGRCSYCKHVFHISELTVDHLIPACRGGTEAYTNLVASCRQCNHLKGDLTVKQFKYLIRGTIIAILEGDKHISSRWDSLANRYMNGNIKFLHEIADLVEEFSIKQTR